MVGFIIEIILGLVVIRIALYIFNLIDGADMFLIDTCIITGTLLLVISALPIILGLYGVIQYFIH